MKRYKEYMDSVTASDTLHEKLKGLKAPQKEKKWKKYGLIAAALVLVVAGVTLLSGTGNFQDDFPADTGGMNMDAADNNEPWWSGDVGEEPPVATGGENYDLAGSWEEVYGIHVIVEIEEITDVLAEDKLGRHNRQVIVCKLIYSSMGTLPGVDEENIVPILFPIQWVDHAKTGQIVLAQVFASSDEASVYMSVSESEVYVTQFEEGKLVFEEALFPDEDGDGLYPFDTVFEANRALEEDDEKASIVKETIKKPLQSGMTVEETIEFFQGYAQAMEECYAWEIASKYSEHNEDDSVYTFY